MRSEWWPRAESSGLALFSCPAALAGGFAAIGRLGSRGRFRPGRPLPGALGRLPNFLREPDDDALRAANVGQAIRVLVPHFADERGPVGAQARNDIVDVIDGEHDATEAQRVHRRV